MSGLPFELMLALRYLRPKRTFVSIITLISVLGVMLGVAVLIIVISVMTGFDRQMRDKILGFNAHVRVFQLHKTMENYPAVAAKVATNKLVKGVAPFVYFRVLVETQPLVGAGKDDAPILRGIDPEAESKVSVVAQSMVAGKYDLSGNGLLIGSTLADALEVRVGDRISIYSPNNLRKMREAQKAGKEVAVKPTDYTINGVFDVGHFEFNSQFLITSLANAQDLFELEDTVHGLVVTLNDPYQASIAKQELRAALGTDYQVKTWMEENSTILEALAVEKNVMFYLLFFIVLVAAFGITSALITFVVQKTREIGVLKALGTTAPQIMVVFVSQSLVVGVLGVISGCGLGMVAVHYRNEFLEFLRRRTSWELFPQSIYVFRELPAVVVPGDIVIIGGISLLICLLAGLIPAWIASRLKPVEALRHE